MRILFFINTLGAGGKERRLTELMKALVLRQDIEIDLVIMSDEIHYKEILDLGINIHTLLRKSRFDIFVFYRFYQLCRRYRPDIVHCWDSMTAVYSVPVCKALRIKLINGMVTNSITQQSILNKHWLRAKLTFLFSDYIVGNSHAGLKAYQVPERKGIVIYNGFNFDRINNLVTGNLIRDELKINTKYIVGMVATFSKYKDYETYFKSAHLLLQRRKDVTFLAIGNGTDSDYSKRSINKQYSEYFRLLGKKNDIESYIDAIDICVLATFTEGISNSIMEYMALGKPVIATDGGGTNELVLDNITGFLVKPSDPEELSEKIDMLIKDNNLRITMGMAGRQRITDKFSINHMVGKYIFMYKAALK
ncbi:MAG: glycosyltransferase [Bacteroidetes bacterium]|nr:glycosyltransferase [Bacteroidota bacterium]